MVGIIKHRVNDIHSLIDLDAQFGCEIDVRSNKNSLIIHHDPFQPGILLKEWLEEYKHGYLIVNIKEEGIERRVQDLLSVKGVERYFFLDVSVPFMVKLTSEGITNFAVRFSEYESLSLAKRFSKSLNWIWIDSFNKFNHSFDDLLYIKELNLIPCFVSPELQGRFDLSEVQYIKNLAEKAFGDDYYVCTKHPEFWQS